MTDDRLLQSRRPVGIVGYGAYVPRYRLPATEVARVWRGGSGGLPVKEKAAAPSRTPMLLNRLRRSWLRQ
jgi:hypothetical protein